MSFFDEKYTLLDYTKKTILGIASEDLSNEDAVLVTFTSSVNCYQSLKGSLINTWTTKKDYKITTSAVYSKPEDEFVFVLNDNILATIAGKDFNEFSSFKQSLNIFSLLPIEGKEPLVVFEDGSMYTAEYCMSDQKDLIKSTNVISLKNEQLLNAFTIKINGNIFPCLLFANLSDSNQNFLIIKKNSTYKTIDIDICDKIVDSCICHQTKDSQSLCIICESGDVYSVKISIAESKELQLSCNKVTTVDVACTTNAVALGENKVAILCKQNKVVVIETHLGAIVETVILHSRIKQISLFPFKDGLAIKTTKSLIIYPIGNEAANLATIVAARQHEVVVDSLVESTQDSAQDSTVEKMEDTLPEIDDAALFKTLMTTINEQNFAESWFKFWKNRNEFDKMKLSNSHELKTVLQRFNPDNKKKFWPKTAIVKMLKSQMIPGKYCGDIVRKVVKHKDWNLALMILKNCQNIPEDILVCLLEGVLSSDFETVVTDKKATACMDKLLTNEFTVVALKSNLRMLPIDIVQKLMKYIVLKFNTHTPVGKTKNFFEALIDWANVLIDSQISNLVLTEDCWSIVESLQTAFKQQSEIFKELDLIGTYVDQISSKTKIKSNSEYTKYIVQVMKL